MSPLWTRVRRLALVALALVALPTLLVGVANAWVRWSTRGHSYAAVDAVPARSVAIVPGARTHKGHPLAALSERLATALELYETGRVHAILVSGSNAAEDPQVTTMVTWLEARGVPATDVLVDVDGDRTRDTMSHAAQRFDVKDAIVCTQSLHLPRSLFLAQHAGIDAVGVEIPTPLSSSLRWIAIESAKDVLAVGESLVGRAAPDQAKKASDPVRTIARR